jgi:hypothetical protein
VSCTFLNYTCGKVRAALIKATAMGMMGEGTRKKSMAREDAETEHFSAGLLSRGKFRSSDSRGSL